MGNSTYTAPRLHRAKVFNVGGQTIAQNVLVPVTLNTVSYNVGSLGTSGNVITLKADGIYHIIAFVLFGQPNPFSGGDYHQVTVTAGGNTVSGIVNSGVSDFAGSTRATWVGQLSSGDTVSMTAKHNGSGGIDLTAETSLAVQMLRRL